MRGDDAIGQGQYDDIAGGEMSSISAYY
jgi:hypothetical protein